ncbi:MAG: adenylate kinase [Erysipelotrichaceae bacterium]|nr:adenylate kinase [Erysipelotrichaceae bacterium]
MDKKIIIIGPPGAGKSTFSFKLQELTGLPLYHLDLLYHKPDKTTVSKEEFDKKLNEILKKDEWIIDGLYLRTLESRLKDCDLIYFFDLPIEECLQGVINRKGKVRKDMPWVEEELDEEFMAYIRQFPDNQYPRMLAMMERYKDKPMIVFKSHEEADEYLKGYGKQTESDTSDTAAL